MTVDYHSAEAITVTVTGTKGWKASCDCGWLGPCRDLKADADADALAHDTSENQS